MTTKELENKLKISENTCIHCSTLELAKQVLSIFHKLGLKWCNGIAYTKCTDWDRYKENTIYYPFDGRFSHIEYAQQNHYKIISAKEFIALHTEEFNLENYVPKGELIGFPKEIIARMLECQKEQVDRRDVTVFENLTRACPDIHGFSWNKTKEGYDFWEAVIEKRNFDLFFERYPKQGVCSECKECRKQEYQESKTAKYVQVGDNAISSDSTSTQSSVEIEINTNEEDSQEFRVGDKVIDIIKGKIGKVISINTLNKDDAIFVDFNDDETTGYTLDGRYYSIDKYPRLLHYRDDYDYSVIDFNNLPQRQEPNRWRAENGRLYYFVDFQTKNCSFSNETKDDYVSFDNDNYNSGNYFRTEVEAEIIAQKLNSYFKQLIQEEHECERN